MEPVPSVNAHDGSSNTARFDELAAHSKYSRVV